MQRSGTGSWRLGYGLGQMPHAVIYVRDALRVPLEHAAGIPPRLLGEVPDRSALLEGVDVTVAAREWVSWWHAVGQIEARTLLGGESPAELGAEYGRILDPNTSPAMGDSLRAVAQSLYREGCSWADSVEPALGQREATLGGFEWHLLRNVVEDVAAEADVSVAAMSGAVSVVLVDGVWDAIAAPGFAWCSIAAAQDPRVCAEIVRATLKAGLGAH